jgi:hypothetical protein
MEMAWSSHCMPEWQGAQSLSYPRPLTSDSRDAPAWADQAEDPPKPMGHPSGSKNGIAPHGWADLRGTTASSQRRNARAWAGQAENPPKPLRAFGWTMMLLTRYLMSAALMIRQRLLRQFASLRPHRKCPGLGGPGGKPAQAYEGIRLARLRISFNSHSLSGSSFTLARCDSLLAVCTGNAQAWAGQAEYPPKPVWAFGWSGCITNRRLAKIVRRVFAPSYFVRPVRMCPGPGAPRRKRAPELKGTFIRPRQESSVTGLHSCEVKYLKSSFVSLSCRCVHLAITVPNNTPDREIQAEELRKRLKNKSVCAIQHLLLRMIRTTRPNRRCLTLRQSNPFL